MGRLSMVLAVLLMLSAISLVTARFQSRQLFVATEVLSAKERDLETDWRRLQLERAELARNARTDTIARKELGMTSVGPDRIIYMEDASMAQGGTQ
ncbi:cell division protein FtsL [Pusillimonas sp. CC-YST705]|uniref:Cell division protein FtsL n=1 Tax=Mesopusillimonas faecipullorum TaxID=2755040 RepID=A0ABS8C9B0_9BURK|nr:cell division protein FtsL [Mesopusillimonas faecipullorum]MCB5362610.1 cell division protein FtsL [Mesopusillimonas faecipullorum]